MMPKPERGYFEEPALRLARTDEIYCAAESTPFQLKLVEDSTTNVSVVNTTPKVPECPNCGRTHDTKTRQQSPAFRKTCRKYKKWNHFVIKCRSKRTKPGVRTLEEVNHGDKPEEDIDSQLVTLWLESGSYVRFQVDTGAQCNGLPLSTYREATVDVALSNVTPIKTRVRAYGGGTLLVVGSVKLKFGETKQSIAWTVN